MRLLLIFPFVILCTIAAKSQTTVDSSKIDKLPINTKLIFKSDFFINAKDSVAIFCPDSYNKITLYAIDTSHKDRRLPKGFEFIVRDVKRRSVEKKVDIRLPEKEVINEDGFKYERVYGINERMMSIYIYEIYVNNPKVKFITIETSVDLIKSLTGGSYEVFTIEIPDIIEDF